ncbi:kinase-like domain-containing protein [Cladochytrium replicatum]|nr:kinase-like domain-containing protein [Cladochytrium replicatum]
MQQDNTGKSAAVDPLARYIADSSSDATTTTDLSSVTHAIDSVTSKHVVLKRTLLDDEFGDQEHEFLTFIAERSPCEHIVTLLDSFEENTDADGSEGTLGRRRVLVLPALDRAVLRQPDLWAVREYMWQLLAALGTVHALGIVHLDITPANVMRDPQTGKFVLIDFGLARKVPPLPDPSDPESCTLPEPHPVGRGTAGYIAPEMFSGSAYTAAPDVYSAGVIFGQFLETYIPGFGLNYLGSKLVRPNPKLHRHLLLLPPYPRRPNATKPPPPLDPRAHQPRRHDLLHRDYLINQLVRRRTPIPRPIPVVRPPLALLHQLRGPLRPQPRRRRRADPRRRPHPRQTALAPRRPRRHGPTVQDAGPRPVVSGLRDRRARTRVLCDGERRV